MMDETVRPLTLLATKGGARPALRSQLQAIHADDSLADNDLSAEIADSDAPASNAPASNVRLIRRDVAVSLVPRASRAVTPRRRAFDQNRRAAFTLRIDAERHAQLRLACTAANRSAQSVLTEALDRLITDIAGADSRPQRT
ncbi:MAG: hypothetical protein ABI673_05770 [Novosphingobium sp.]